MLIVCPYCGAREAQEFAYRGDATVRRPDPAAPDAAERFHDYVYLRDNPAGPHRWVEVSRDTRTHAISATRFAAEGEARR